MPTVMALRGSKSTYLSAEATLAQARQLQVRPVSFAPPQSLDKQVDVSLERINGWPVYTVSPRGSATQRRGSSHQVLYLHGGSWIHEISPFHWRFIAALTVDTGATFTVPIYPLAPLGTAATVVPAVGALAAALIADGGADSVTLMGDSAGGTIALAAAQHLRDSGSPAPRRIILLSPAVDLTFSDPRIAELADSDPWLATPGLRATADLWRGDLPLTDPLVSPLFGDLAGLSPIAVLSGTRDILNADARALQRALQHTATVDLIERDGLLHVYPLLPIPEAAEARRSIGALLAP
ncbi:MAG: esterase [Glaciihabitans sp.]|nr:esterase [Glaciihabitans sp.]